MCGFAGIWNSFEFNNDEQKDVLKKMIYPLKHRGPDDLGFWNQDSKGPGFAHSRLAIQDLSESGHQPMISASGRYVIVYNGEIYNHFDIRNELNNLSKSRISWKGKSDTETLLYAFEYFSIEKVLNKLIGMFAFALWDRKHRRLFLARDRFGEKPLYYGLLKLDRYDNRKNLVFGSELTAFTGLNTNLIEINKKAVNAFFQYGYIPSPLSIYSDIRKLKPGHFIQIYCDENSGYSPEFISNEVQWYKTSDIANNLFLNQESYIDSDYALQKLEAALLASINSQTISDVPLGTFLSGGIDSSLITALLQLTRKDPVSSFTISFPDDEFGNNNSFNEAPFAKTVASSLGTNHTEINLTYKDVQSLIPNLSGVYSEPFSDSSQVPTFLVCREAKKAGLSVMMSGDGGDELFGGYNRHKFGPLIYENLYDKPFIVRNLISKIVEYLPIINKGLNREKKYKLYKAIRNSHNLNSIYYSLISIFTDQSKPLNNNWRSNNLTFINSISDQLTPSEQFMINDLLNYLPGDILVKIDRAAMNVSLETRAPFLDHRVAEIAWSLPLELKINRKGYKYKSKWALKEILKKYVPENIINRPKSGFAMPIGQWLRGPLKNWADDLLDPSLLSRQGFLDPKKVNCLWEKHLNGSIENTNKIWTILMWQAWLKEWR
tara:strand:- start:20293 stop:22275 length:1983 start_codon:yes stop_codon:yes gene_type:complete